MLEEEERKKQVSEIRGSWKRGNGEKSAEVRMKSEEQNSCEGSD